MGEPALTIRRRWTRPDVAAVAAFRDAEPGWVADAQGRRGALDHRIRPVTSAKRFLGTALTVWTSARDNLAPYAALAFAQPGDVMLIASDGHETAAIAGDVLVGMARNAGITALVTDGIARDLDGLEAVGIPVFATGISPNSPQKDGPGEIGLPLAIGGVVVQPGDLVLGTQDGVVVVPQGRLAEVAAALADIRAKEAQMDAAVRGGAKQPGWLAERLTRPDIDWVD